MSRYISLKNLKIFWDNIKLKLFPNDSSIVDYVVDSGIVTQTTNNINYNWYYKKWSNGFCEAWSHQEYNNESKIGNATSSYTWFLYNKTIEIPESLFISNPFSVFANASVDDAPDSKACGGNWNRENNKIICHFPVLVWSRDTANIKLNLYAIGYWR